MLGAGEAVDLTVRVAGVQIEQGDYASDLMLPPPGEIRATTRVGRTAATTPAARTAA